MTIKWNKTAVKQLMDAVLFIEEHGFYDYAEKLEAEIISRIKSIPKNPQIHISDKYKKDNDGSYYAFEIDRYRISYRIMADEIRIIRIRHTSRNTRKYYSIHLAPFIIPNQQTTRYISIAPFNLNPMETAAPRYEG